MPGAGTASKESTLKKLFALSHNRCAFSGCTTQIVDSASDVLTGQICHIKARNPGGPRYDEKQTEEQRHAFENLIILCGVHHKIVDNQPTKFTAQLLFEMKDIHEREGNIELSQEDARLARLLISEYFAAMQRPDVTQTVIGNHNVTIAGDQNIYQHPPKLRVVVPRREGAISVAQCRTVQKWIETLAENTTGMAREQAFGMWWTIFKNRFGLNRYEELEATQFDEAKSWYQQQRAILTRGLKNKVPDAWRNARYAAIKQAMQVLGVSNDLYYPQVTERLKLRRPFTSLTQLTKRDLERAYAMARNDARKLASGG
jgi:hypothetical protein